MFLHSSYGMNSALEKESFGSEYSLYQYILGDGEKKLLISWLEWPLQEPMVSLPYLLPGLPIHSLILHLPPETGRLLRPHISMMRATRCHANKMQPHKFAEQTVGSTFV